MAILDVDDFQGWRWMEAQGQARLDAENAELEEKARAAGQTLEEYLDWHSQTFDETEHVYEISLGDNLIVAKTPRVAVTITDQRVLLNEIAFDLNFLIHPDAV